MKEFQELKTDVYCLERLKTAFYWPISIFPTVKSVIGLSATDCGEWNVSRRNMTDSSAAKLRRLCLNAHLRTSRGLTYPRRYTVSVAQASGERLRFVTLMIANRERHGDLHGAV